MNFTFATQNQPCTLCIKVRSLKPCTVRLQVYDYERPNTLLTNRFKIFKNAAEEFDFYVQMPTASPRHTGILIFDDAIGDRPVEQETSFEVIGGAGGIKKYGPPKKLDIAQLKSPDVEEFMDFAWKFCFNLSTLASNPPGELYCSSSKKYQIQLTPILTDESGVEVSTPARINRFTNVIEVSKRKFLTLTVPGRICILCHEYSHKYLNNEASDELEADLNGLTIYLAEGYPRIEAFEVFINTFYALPSDENLQRFKHIEDFIARFDEFYFKAA